ncbi:MAG: hypothetical protein DRI57_15680 [Deltaproteobacteria bacterium]|nr:MAG: hypothetical protein DRI57_15680 [Deltaproteobacteria bacterium]
MIMKKIMALAILPLVAVCMIGGQACGAGYKVINDSVYDFQIDALIHTEDGLTEAVFRKGGEDMTPRGDSVIWGYFYADPADVSWGSENNPEVYVKIWFDITGRIDVNFFHVSVPDITVFSAYPWHGTIYDRHDTLSTESRHIRHEYWLRRLISNYSYDAEGNLARAEYDRDGDHSPDQIEYHTFTREGNNAVEKVETDDDADGIPDRSRTETRTYDAGGNLTESESGSYVHTYTYDDRGNLIKEKHEEDGTVYMLLSHTLTYDGDGNIIKKETDRSDYGTEVFTYAYDADGNMTKEVYQGPEAELGPVRYAHSYTYIYTYDAGGRMVRKESVGEEGDVRCSAVFTYDARGNLIKNEPGYGDRGKIYSPHMTYAYDADGRLTKKVTTGYWGGDCLEMPSLPWDELPVGVYDAESGGMIINIPHLPESAKGYELYSWFSKDRWHFTLITGTDRIKAYEEVCSDEGSPG